MKQVAEVSETVPVENPPGIIRKTLAYTDQVMMCHFDLTAGAVIAIHNHPAVQTGYVIRGRLKFLRDNGEVFVVTAGTSYVFGPNETHGVEVLEAAEVIECFAPSRPEYIDD